MKFKALIVAAVIVGLSACVVFAPILIIMTVAGLALI